MSVLGCSAHHPAINRALEVPTNSWGTPFFEAEKEGLVAVCVPDLDGFGL